MSAQLIKCRCSNRIPFAACLEPDCYEDKDWQKDIRKYSKMGCKVETTDQLFELEVCKCMT